MGVNYYNPDGTLNALGQSVFYPKGTSTKATSTNQPTATGSLNPTSNGVTTSNRAIPDLPNVGFSQAPIVAPARTDLNTAYQSVQATGLIPQYQPINFKPITGLDKSYYDNLYNQASSRLNKQYFSNDDSAKNQLTKTMNQRGLIGSGIEAGSLNSLFQDYGSKLADIGSSLASDQAKNDLDITKYNTEGDLSAQFKNRDYQSQLAQLGLSAAGDEARNQTEYDTKMFEQQIGLEKAAYDQRADVANVLQELLGSQYIDEADKQNYGSELDALLESILRGS